MWETDSRATNPSFWRAEPFTLGENEVTAVDSESAASSGTARTWKYGQRVAVDGRLLLDHHRLRPRLRLLRSAARESCTDHTQARDDVFADAAHHELFAKAAENRRPVRLHAGFCLLVGLKPDNLPLNWPNVPNARLRRGRDPAVVERVRQAADQAAVGGSCRAECWPINEILLRDYFANLLVSESVLVGQTLQKETRSIRIGSCAMLKPVGVRSGPVPGRGGGVPRNLFP